MTREAIVGGATVPLLMQAYSEAGDASDSAAAEGAGSGSGSGSGDGDGGSGSMCLADCSWEVRMVSRQVSVS